MANWTYTDFRLLVMALARIYDCSESSGLRTPARNRQVGGAEHSRHQLIASDATWTGGMAADLVPDVNTSESRAAVAAAARKLGLRAIDESDHVHIHCEP
jgi:hypothetical protein